MVKLKLKLPGKEEYFGSKSLSVLESFNQIVLKANNIGKLVGCEIYSEDFSPYNLTFFSVMVLGFGFMVLNGFSLYQYRKDLERFFFCIATFGSALQIIPVVYTFICRQPDNYNLIVRIRKFLTNFNTERSNAAFEKWLIICCHISVTLLIVIVFCIFLVIIYPIVYYFIFGENILHFGFGLPLIDWTTPFGYSINFVFIVFVVSAFLCGTTAKLIFTTIYITMSFGQFDLLEVLLEDLNELILKNQNGENVREIKNSIRVVTQMHDELLE